MKTLKEQIDTEEEGYSVDCCGNVYSKNYNHTGQEKQMKPYPTGNGYFQVRMNGKPYLIHRIVAKAFCEQPEGKNFINHIDGDKSNNFSHNLEWCTSSENAKHACKTGLWKSTDKHKKAVAKSCRETGLKRRKISDETRKEIQEIYIPKSKLFGAKPLSIIYGVCAGTICDIANKRGHYHD